MGTVNSYHNEARIQFEAFQDQRHSVGNILRVHSHNMEIDYRTCLTAMLDVTRFLLKQGLSFRGHDESTSSSNREITLAIINDIGDKFFSLMVDEARDNSVKEHMGVVLSSHSLKMAIDALFVQHGLSLSRLRGQGYDGASNMCVIEVLGNVHDDTSYFANKGVVAGLIEKMKSYQFVFVLHLMKYILGITNELSLSLQQGDQNIVQVMSLDNMLTRGHGRRRGQLITNFHHYRVEIFCQVVDLIIQEMNNRFSKVSTELLGCISFLHPRNSFSQFDVHKLIHLANFYPEDFCGTDYLFLEQQLMSYFYNLRDDPYFSSIDDLEILAQKLVETEKHLVFPLVYRMIELALVVPVATASVERVFSAMKTVKTDLHNRMRDEWMNDSLVVYIEKDFFSTIENEEILQHFQQMQSRRIQLPLVPTRQPSQTSVMENRSSIKWDKGKVLEF
ncbi:uncharacterized protein LOC122010950 [Zingiber officinale]|uniref:uncharacterized protein LOC122010950 n=1 Tax=Zingiber officinale TaxID=94328 RepID=UPI001C4BF62D|nr:uncharacterized protein LOC122010950 [Zingiber officinale]